MPLHAPLPAPSLPSQVQQVLNGFVDSARSAFGEQLRSIILFGSAAEGQLRTTSDVNVLLVLKEFEEAQADELRKPLRLANTAVQLRAMFLLEEEIVAAVRSFASKFADILRRRCVLYGEDVFASIEIPREAELRQLGQQLLNLTLRLRSVYVARSPRVEQLKAFLAGVIGPLRSTAAGLMELEGGVKKPPNEAFAILGNELGVKDWGEALGAIETIQAGQAVPEEVVKRLCFQLTAFTRLARSRADGLLAKVRP